MSICLNYNDTVRLVKTTVDEYGTQVISDQEEVPAIFGQTTGFGHGSNQDAILSDAVAYLDPTNEFVIENFYRLEGMLLVAQLFGVSLEDAWYRITDISVARTSLTCNDIDNIQVGLKKTTGILGVS